MDKNRLAKHMANLRKIFPDMEKDLSDISLYGLLAALEETGNRLAMDMCNVGVPDKKVDQTIKDIEFHLDKLTGYKKAGVPVFINTDPRGYALKIDDAYLRKHDLSIETDMGGYGIICPDFKDR